ncbi:hypothetical protein DFH09DRAFT_1105585, partial [Mycena vulgaris]
WFCAMLPRARFDGDSGDLGLQLANGSTATSGKPARPCRPTWCENHVWSSQRLYEEQREKSCRCGGVERTLCGGLAKGQNERVARRRLISGCVPLRYRQGQCQCSGKGYDCAPARHRVRVPSRLCNHLAPRNGEHHGCTRDAEAAVRVLKAVCTRALILAGPQQCDKKGGAGRTAARGLATKKGGWVGLDGGLGRQASEEQGRRGDWEARGRVHSGLGRQQMMAIECGRRRRGARSGGRSGE